MQRFYDSNMQLLGYFLQGPQGRVRALDADYRVVGYYYPSSDKTYDKDMNLLGRGNQLASLLSSRGQ